MKFFHLSDLHIGKQLHHYNLRGDQERILSEVISYAEDIHPDALLIAGDIYDKSVPSGEAVSLFDDFLTRLSNIRPAIPVLIIAGNHDSAQRLDYASRLLGSHHIYISGKAPETEGEHLKKVALTDEYGEVYFYLLPFLKPGYVRGLHGGELPESYTDAVKMVLEREGIDFSRRNVLVSHQFYTGNGEMPETCDSELLSVGGIDNVDISVVKDFDYVALGHLHGAQRVGMDHIRYCGTLLKYSVSEAGQEKSLHVVELGAKGEPVHIEKLPLHPLRDVRKLRGNLADIIARASGNRQADVLQQESIPGQADALQQESIPGQADVSQQTDVPRQNDYVSVTLTDEVDPYKPKEQLEKVYSHILEVRTDNERTRKKLEFSEADIRIENPLSVFSEFYREMQGREMTEEEQDILGRVFDTVRGDEP